MQNNKIKSKLSGFFSEDIFCQPIKDLIISGQKKCGTKALQFFLLHHPDIIGTRDECQLRGNKNFTFELSSYLGKLNFPDDKNDNTRVIGITFNDHFLNLR